MTVLKYVDHVARAEVVDVSKDGGGFGRSGEDKDAEVRRRWQGDGALGREKVEI